MSTLTIEAENSRVGVPEGGFTSPTEQMGSTYATTGTEGGLPLRKPRTPAVHRRSPDITDNALYNEADQRMPRNAFLRRMAAQSSPPVHSDDDNDL